MKAGNRRILINCLSAGSGGALGYIRNLLPRLVDLAAQQGAQQEFVVLHNSRLRDSFSVIGDTERVEVPEAWTSSPYVRAIWEKRNLHRLVKEREIDRVFLPAQFGAIARGADNILMIRNMEPFLYEGYDYALAKRFRNSLLAPASRRALRSADRVIAVSEFAKRYCLEHCRIPEERLSLVYHGRDSSFSPVGTDGDASVLAKHGVSGDYIFSCGSMLPYRRFEDVIGAYCALVAQKPDAPPLILAGGEEDGRYAQKIRSLIDQAGPQAKVRHIGRLAYGEIQVFYRNCLVFVMSSEIEACPNVAIEAMSSGCAVVSCSKPPMPEIFQEAALYYPARDTEALAARIGELLDSPENRREISHRAVERADFFSWDKCAEETLAVLSSPPSQMNNRA